MAFPSSIWTRILDLRGEPSTLQGEIAERYQQPVFEFIRLHVPDLHDAEDLTQDVFIQICREDFLRQLDPARGRFRAILCTVTRRCIDRFHRHRLAGVRDRRREIPIAALDEEPEASSHDAFDRLWCRNLVAMALSELNGDPGLKAYRLHLLGRSSAEIARELDWNETRVRNELHRGKTKLRRRIERIIRDYSGSDVEEEVASLLRRL